MSSVSDLVARTDGKVGLTENGDPAWWNAVWLGPGEKPLTSTVQFSIDNETHSFLPNSMVRLPLYPHPYGQLVETRWCNEDSMIDTSIYEGAGGKPERYDVDDNGEPLWYAAHVIGLCEGSHASAIAVEYDDDSVQHAHVPLRYVRDRAGAIEGAASEETAAAAAILSVTPPPPSLPPSPSPLAPIAAQDAPESPPKRACVGGGLGGGRRSKRIGAKE